jgi:hypothetical protein
MLRPLTLLLAVWLVIGVAASWQRDYFQGKTHTCAKAGTIAATVVAGPLNYFGANPKVHCATPRPSG